MEENLFVELTVASLLDQYWGLKNPDVRPLAGGMNSHTWSVRHQGRAYVAKMVAQSASSQLRNGCEIAAQLADAGLTTGRPQRTRDGQLVAGESLVLALLEFVAGRELDGRAPDEQTWMAHTLAKVHLIGAPGPGPSGSAFFPWLTVDAPGLDKQPWLVPAVTAVRNQADSLSLTWSVLHTDPAPEAFRHDDTTGTTGLIDWTGAQRGPVLYDIASATMYLGGLTRAGRFLHDYGNSGPLAEAEWQHLETMLRFRWAVQAVYFAGRLEERNLTGVRDQSDNERGLSDAREGLASLGIKVG